MSRPGRDIGLEPYPLVGYATYEEAEAAFKASGDLDETTD